MKELKTEIIINAPQGKVWQVLTDFRAYPAWNPFIVSIEGKATAGARLSTKMIQSGKEHKFTPCITQLKEEEQLEWLGALPLGMFKGNHYFHLQMLGPAQTRLLHGERFSGWLSGLILHKIGKETLLGFQHMNRALKERAEGI